MLQEMYLILTNVLVMKNSDFLVQASDLLSQAPTILLQIVMNHTGCLILVIIES